MLAIITSVLFFYIVPAIFFTLYLTYGLVRPWVSRRWRKEIEEPSDDDILAMALESGSEADLEVVDGGKGAGGKSGRRRA